MLVLEPRDQMKIGVHSVLLLAHFLAPVLFQFRPVLGVWLQCSRIVSFRFECRLIEHGSA